MDSLSTSYPLENVSETQLLHLCEVLWAWKLCEQCEAGQPCETQACPKQRLRRLACFFKYYKDVTRFYVPELWDGESNALRTHEDLIDIIQSLKSWPNLPRVKLTHQYFSTRDGGQAQIPPLVDQNRAFNLAVRVMIMVNCSLASQDSDLLELGVPSVPWRQDMAFGGFMEEAFPKIDHPSLDEKKGASVTSNILTRISAKNLKKLAGLRFQPTDDLRHHLKLDRKDGILEIYHHTTVIKEHLNSTLDSLRPSNMIESIARGNIPRQLALEVLDSIQQVLFPSDSDSQSLLRSLVSKASFDPDCLRYESAAYRSMEENEIGYIYFGSRIMDLYEEIENPRPRGLIEKWVERRSGARYVMMATLIGVMVAVILGLLGLAVAIFQAWVAYQQWKHPISTNLLS